MPEQEINISFTFEFKRNLRRLAKKYRSIRSDIQPIIDQLLRGELPGDKISGVMVPIYKLRLINSDIQKGKRAGYRCLYYHKDQQNIILVTIYSKSDQSDIRFGVGPNQVIELIVQIASAGSKIGLRMPFLILKNQL